MATFRLAVSYANRDCMLKRPPLPEWLNPDRDWGIKKKHSYQYWTKIYWATPPWLNEEQLIEMKRLYNSAKRGDHIDHIVPLKSPIVCGLHVPWNIEVVSEEKNLYKSNHMWPGHPCENLDLFEKCHA